MHTVSTYGGGKFGVVSATVVGVCDWLHHL